MQLGFKKGKHEFLGLILAKQILILKIGGQSTPGSFVPGSFAGDWRNGEGWELLGSHRIMPQCLCSEE